MLAAAAFIVGYRVYTIESGRDARAEQDRRERTLDERRRQAALVSAWYAFGPTDPKVHWRFRGGPAWGGRVLNASEQPIYDALIHFYRSGPDGSGDTPWRSRLLKVVPPGQGTIIVDPQAEGGQVPQSALKDLEISMAFRDAAGRHWLRDVRGNLVEQPTYPWRGPAERQGLRSLTEETAPRAGPSAAGQG